MPFLTAAATEDERQLQGISALKVAELKAQLSQRGAVPKGNKPELAAQLTALLNDRIRIWRRTHREASAVVWPASGEVVAMATAVLVESGGEDAVMVDAVTVNAGIAGSVAVESVPRTPSMGPAVSVRTAPRRSWSRRVRCVRRACRR